MAKRYDYAVYIGRFQPFHDGHLHLLQHALHLSERVVLVIGSIRKARDIRNPWTFEERKAMVLAALPEDCQVRVSIVGVSDSLYNDQQWVEAVQSGVDGLIRADDWALESDTPPKKVCLVGHERDHTSYYLKMFPQWDLQSFEAHGKTNATSIRQAYFGREEGDENMSEEEVGQLPVPSAVAGYLSEFSRMAQYQDLVREWRFIATYKQQYAALKYPVIHVTTDAVVIQSGHVLLVRRKSFPGKGLWALPGGFVEAEETLQQAALRELKEETGIKVPGAVLAGSIRANRAFDHPDRSMRGRTITHAYLLELAPGPLPKVKGGSDAVKARWVSLAEFKRMENCLFEDHFHIVNYFLGRV